ncbi:MAG: hypothetical protein IJS09_07875 [Treponema sp.]|nr:hypothetical protein [Treponema sp.]
MFQKKSVSYLRTSVFICVIVATLFLSCSRPASFSLEIPGAPDEAVSMFVSGGMDCFSFTDGHNQALEEFLSTNKDAAVQITIAVKKQKQTAQSGIGFLYKDDFSSFGLKSDRASRPQISADFSQFAKLTFSVIFCVNKDAPLPAGFYVKSPASYKVISAKIVRAQVGFDFRQKEPVFAFTPNGGTIEKPYFKTDFTGVPMTLNATQTAQSLLPQMEVHFRKTDPEHDSAPVKLTVGGERITIRPSGDSVVIPCASLKSPFAQAMVDENEVKVAALLVRASDPKLLAFKEGTRYVTKPVRTDPGLIMAWSRDTWRGNEYELFEWERFPGVLFFDTLDYKVQDDFFRRLAYFVEKAGYRGKLLDDESLADKHGYNAHDYSAESLADFFEAARRTRFPLNQKELLLYEILVVNGVLVQNADGSIGAGKGAVISISQESSRALRYQFVAHEGWHGLFFIDGDFRNTVASIYYTMDKTTLEYLRRYFQVTPSLNYDVDDDYLMKNEFMAYMLQKPVSEVGPYFVAMASRSHSQLKAKALADYIISTEAAGFTSAATLLEEYVRDRWNLAAGRVWLVSR